MPAHHQAALSADPAKSPQDEDEKRRTFLERNRQGPSLSTDSKHTCRSSYSAALKCRQKKKEWLTDLQHNVETLSAENESYIKTIEDLRNEIAVLKQALTMQQAAAPPNDYMAFPAQSITDSTPNLVKADKTLQS